MTKKTMINGLSINIEGQNTEAILFIHGFPNNKKIWSKIIDKLKSEYTCISVDLPSFWRI